MRLNLMFAMLIIIFFSCTQPEPEVDKQKNTRPISPSSDYILTPDELTTLKDKAIKGDPEAAYRVADYYDFIKLDDKEAMKWLEMAAKGGLVLAQYNLAQALSSRSDKESYVQAIYWYQRAAEAGDKDALIHLAEIYEKGKFIEKDFQKVKSCYEKIALHGDYGAMLKISEYYSEGKGVSKDFIQAYLWMKSAESHVDPTSVIGLEILSKKKRILAQLSSEDLKSAEKQYEQLSIQIKENERVSGVTKM